jgi:hypothetical protein
LESVEVALLLAQEFFEEVEVALVGRDRRGALARADEESDITFHERGDGRLAAFFRFGLHANLLRF